MPVRPEYPDESGVYCELQSETVGKGGCRGCKQLLNIPPGLLFFSMVGYLPLKMVGSSVHVGDCRAQEFLGVIFLFL